MHRYTRRLSAGLFRRPSDMLTYEHSRKSNAAALRHQAIRCFADIACSGDSECVSKTKLDKASVVHRA
jgi:hypothetical protein